MWTCTQLLSAKYCNLLRKTKLQNSYFPHAAHSGKKKKQKQNISSLVELSWVFPSFHVHKGLILRAVESPMAIVVGPLGTVSFPPQHTQSTLTAVLWRENAQEKDVKEVPQSFFSREGSAKEQDSASGYWGQSLRLSIIGYYGSHAFTVFTCLSTPNPCISLCGGVRESV